MGNGTSSNNNGKRSSGARRYSITQDYKLTQTVLGRGGSSHVVEAIVKNVDNINLMRLDSNRSNHSNHHSRSNSAASIHSNNGNNDNNNNNNESNDNNNNKNNDSNNSNSDNNVSSSQFAFSQIGGPSGMNWQPSTIDEEKAKDTYNHNIDSKLKNNDSNKSNNNNNNKHVSKHNKNNDISIDLTNNTNIIGDKCAIKIIPKKNQMVSAESLYLREISILLELQGHPNILKLYDYKETKSNYYIITQLCNGGSLMTRIQTSDEKYYINEVNGYPLMRDIISCIQHCHSKHIVHGDLKPENFLFETPEVNSKIILIDFGTAVKIEDNNTNKIKNKNKSDEKTENDIKKETATRFYNAMLGTAYYMAPEVIKKSREIELKNKGSDGRRRSSLISQIPGQMLYGTDVWSLGIIAFLMICRRLPFTGAENPQIFHSIVNDEIKFSANQRISKNFQDFVSKLLIKDPNKRMTLGQALLHPWINGISDETVAKHEEKKRNSLLNQQIAPYLQQFNSQTKLKQEISRLLARDYVSKNIEKQIKLHFDRLDTNNDKKIDRKDLKILLTDIGGFSNDNDIEEEINNILSQVDIDHSGTIDFEEFKIAWLRKMLTKQEAYINSVFQMIDSNNDGVIDANELQEALGDEYDIDMINDIISEVDSQGTKSVTLREFVDAMKELEIKQDSNVNDSDNDNNNDDDDDDDDEPSQVENDFKNDTNNNNNNNNNKNNSDNNNSGGSSATQSEDLKSDK